MNDYLLLLFSVYEKNSLQINRGSTEGAVLNSFMLMVYVNSKAGSSSKPVRFARAQRWLAAPVRSLHPFRAVSIRPPFFRRWMRVRAIVSGMPAASHVRRVTRSTTGEC